MMEVRRFDPTRAVEVIAPRYGSGYRIGGRLLLTAAHLLPPRVGATCEVRFRPAGGGIWKCDGEVAWLPQGWLGPDDPSNKDAALVTLPEEAGWCEAAVLGQLPDDSRGVKLPFDFYGWPKWGRTALENKKTAAGGRHVDGLIYLADTSPEGLLVIEPYRLPEAELELPGSPWEGISGAAVVCDGVVVAVQRHHQNPRRPGSLEAVLLAPFATDVGLAKALASNGIATSWPTVKPSPMTWERWAHRSTAPDPERALAELLFLVIGEEQLQAMLLGILPDLALPESSDRKITPLVMARLVAMQLRGTEILEGFLDSLRASRPDVSEQIDLVGRYGAADGGEDKTERSARSVRVRARVPKLPNHYIERVECNDLARRVAEARPSLVAITGEVGIGKTTLATGLARSGIIDSAFEGRICWLRPMPEGSDALALQHALFSQLDCQGNFTAQHWISGLDQLTDCIVNAYDDQPIMVVIDDPPEPIAEIIEALDCADSLTLVVVSTNIAALRTTAASEWTVKLARLDAETGMSLLAAWASVNPGGLPQSARDLASMIGYSPLALAMLGATARERGGSEHTWEHLRHKVGSGDIEAVRFPGQPQTRFRILLDRELSALPDQQRRAIEPFAIFPPGLLLDISLLSRIWNLQADDANALATDLAGRSLLMRDDQEFGVSALVRGSIREGLADIAELSRAVLGSISQSPPIFYSIRWHDQPLLTALAQRPADLHQRYGSGITPLLLASLRGWELGVQELLRAGSRVAEASESGWTALHCAAQAGSVAIAGALIAAGADPTRKNDGDKTPLDVAAGFGHAEVVSRLLQEGGQTWTAVALPLASKNGHADVVRQLLNSGKLSANGSPEGGGQALLLAAQAGYESVVFLLLESGVDPDYLQDDLRSLHLSAQNAHLAVVQLLLRRGASVDAEDQRGRTALFFAAQQGNEDVVEVLLHADASPTKADRDGFTALHLSCVSKKAAVVQLLLDAGADADALTNEGLTPLHFAVQQLAAECVIAMLQHGTQVDRRGEGLPTALMFAAGIKSLSGRQQTRMAMTEEGLKMTAYAALFVEPPPDDLVLLLIDAGADVAARDANGDTALHHAARALNPSVIDLLLVAGGDTASKNNMGLTPLDVARRTQSGQPDHWRLTLRDKTVDMLLQRQ